MEVLLFFFRRSVRMRYRAARQGGGKVWGVCACAMGQKKNNKTSTRPSPKFPIHNIDVSSQNYRYFDISIPPRPSLSDILCTVFHRRA